MSERTITAIGKLRHHTVPVDLAVSAAHLGARPNLAFSFFVLAVDICSCRAAIQPRVGGSSDVTVSYRATIGLTARRLHSGYKSKQRVWESGRLQAALALPLVRPRRRHP